MQILFLGTGTSTGVPQIGCDCPVCRQAKEPGSRNHRWRSSILVRTEKTTLLVDSCPDLHEQALAHDLREIDAILYTHEHLDHVAGFDELRAFCWHRDTRLPLYAGTGTMKQLKRMYAWAFSEANTWKGYIQPEAHDHAGKPFVIGDIHVTPVLVVHGLVETYGYVFRHGGRSFGYVPDIKELPESSAAKLCGLDALAMDGLCYPQHRTHLTVDENIALMQRLSPKSGFITHSGHRLDYYRLADSLPDFMEPAFDGLTLEL